MALGFARRQTIPSDCRLMAAGLRGTLPKTRKYVQIVKKDESAAGIFTDRMPGGQIMKSDAGLTLFFTNCMLSPGDRGA